MSLKYLDKTGLTYFWNKVKSKIASITRNDLASISSETYTDIIGSANDYANATFFFATVRPTNYNIPWKVRYKIHGYCTADTTYNAWSEVEFYGSRHQRFYKIFNDISDTGKRPYYYHVLYTLTSTGYNANYGHAIGVGLRSSTNPTNTSYKRTFEIEILETENCTVTMLNSMVKPASVPGYGTTNFNGYSECNGADNGLQETADNNNVDRLLMSNTRITAGTNKVYPYTLIMEDSEGKWQSLVLSNSTGTSKSRNTVGFRPERLWYFSYWGTINSGGTNDNYAYTQFPSIDLRYSTNCGQTLTARKDVYLKGTITNGFFYLTTTWWTQDLPEAEGGGYVEDGYYYMLIGQAYSNYQVSLQADNPIYYVRNGNLIRYVSDAENFAKLDGTDNILLKAYPVGSIYMSVNSTSPATLFGGTWEQIKGRFLLGQGQNEANTTNYWGAYAANTNNFPNGEMGGEPSHILTIDQIPSHRHEGLYWNTAGVSLNSSGSNRYGLRNWNTSGPADEGAWKTGYTGGGQGHSNMPPYLVVYIWKRTA